MNLPEDRESAAPDGGAGSGNVPHTETRLNQLLDLVQVLRDGSLFYAAAASEANRTGEQDLMRTLADTKTLMARDLATVVPAREVEQERDGNDIWRVREAYARCRQALRTRHNGEFARALRSTERRVLDTLWDALCAAKDPTIQHVLERQYGRALQAHERIREMEQAEPAVLAPPPGARAATAAGTRPAPA
jgi:uncharacterized protein (TIGR02284 family)